MINSIASLEFADDGIENVAPPTLASSSAPDWTGFEDDAAIEILEAMGDRFKAGDLAAVRVGAAQLSRKFPDHSYVLREAGRAWINGDSPRDAVQDLTRSLQIDPAQADTWFLLAIAHDRLSDAPSCAKAVSQAWSRDPDNLQYACASAALEARDGSAWVQGFTRLIDLSAEHPDDETIQETLANAYLFHACKDWTIVASEEGGGTLVRTTKKILNLAAGGDIAPGLYPTEAVHIKTAAVCLVRLEELRLTDPELLQQIVELKQVVKAGQSRKLRATWAELGVGGILLLGALMLLGQSILLSGLALLVGGGMIIGSLEPQYRANRIALSRRGQTLGDAALSLVARRQYGGLVYNIFVMATYPFIAAYKVYMNWGLGWLAKAPITDVAGSRLEIAMPAIVEADAETGEVVVIAPQVTAPEQVDLEDTEEAPEEAASVEKDDEEDPVGVLATTEPTVAPADNRQISAEQAALRWREPIPNEPLLAEAIAPKAEVDQRAAGTAMAAPPIRQASPTLKVAPDPASRPLAARASQIPSGALFAGPLQRPRLPTLPPVAWAGLAAVIVSAVGLAGWAALRTRPDAISTMPAAMAPIHAQGTVAEGMSAPPKAVTLSGSPKVLNTSTLTINGVTISLDGITGESGTPAQEMEQFISKQGGSVSCEGLPNGLYKCRTPAGYDIASAALFNGAARVSNSASAEYRKLQSDAQASRKGFWQ